jgi:hypothetical protein
VRLELATDLRALDAVGARLLLPAQSRTGRLSGSELLTNFEQ